MHISELGGEFALIDRLIGAARVGRSVVVANGDDGAVVRVGQRLLVATTDSLVENRHFSFRYFFPWQVGAKAVESAASDVAAMGGNPKYLLISLFLPANTKVKVVDELYRGISVAARRLGCEILGGNIASGVRELIISTSVLGEISSTKKILRRSGAKPEELIMVSGNLGSSAAGLFVLKRKIGGFKKLKHSHLNPRCRVDLVKAVSGRVSAAIDISDGLARDLGHLCRASGVGAVIDASKIPINPQIRRLAAQTKLDPLSFALAGGEDYELLFTVPGNLRAKVPGIVIGRVTRGQGVLLERDGNFTKLGGEGFDHFLKRSSSFLK